MKAGRGRGWGAPWSAWPRSQAWSPVGRSWSLVDRSRSPIDRSAICATGAAASRLTVTLTGDEHGLQHWELDVPVLVLVQVFELLAVEAFELLAVEAFSGGGATCLNGGQDDAGGDRETPKLPLSGCDDVVAAAGKLVHESKRLAGQLSQYLPAFAHLQFLHVEALPQVQQ